MRRRLGTVGIPMLVMVLLLGGCASTHVVRCDSKLTPINAPMQVKVSS